MNIREETEKYSKAVERLQYKLQRLNDCWRDSYSDERCLQLIECLQMAGSMIERTEYLEDSLQNVFSPRPYLKDGDWIPLLWQATTSVQSLADIVEDLPAKQSEIIRISEHADECLQELTEQIHSLLLGTIGKQREILGNVESNIGNLLSSIKALRDTFNHCTEEEIRQRYAEAQSNYEKTYWQENRADYIKFTSRVKRDLEGRKQPGTDEPTSGLYTLEYNAFYEELVSTRAGQVWRESTPENHPVLLWQQNLTDEETRDFFYHLKALEWLEEKKQSAATEDKPELHLHIEHVDNMSFNDIHDNETVNT